MLQGLVVWWLRDHPGMKDSRTVPPATVHRHCSPHFPLSLSLSWDLLRLDTRSDFTELSAGKTYCETQIFIWASLPTISPWWLTPEEPQTYILLSRLLSEKNLWQEEFLCKELAVHPKAFCARSPCDKIMTEGTTAEIHSFGESLSWFVFRKLNNEITGPWGNWGWKRTSGDLKTNPFGFLALLKHQVHSFRSLQLHWKEREGIHYLPFSFRQLVKICILRAMRAAMPVCPWITLGNWVHLLHQTFYHKAVRWEGFNSSKALWLYNVSAYDAVKRIMSLLRRNKRH